MNAQQLKMGIGFKWIFALLTNLVEFVKPIRLYAISARDDTAEPGAFAYPTAATDKQNSRIVAVGFFKRTVDVSGWDAIDTAGWAALVTSDDLVKLGPVTGQWPEASENTQPGDGYLEETFESGVYDVNFHHYGPDANMELYSRLQKQSRNGLWSALFVFEDQKIYVPLDGNLKPVPVKVFARPVSLDDAIGGSRKMQVNVKWRSEDLPYVIPGDVATWKLN